MTSAHRLVVMGVSGCGKSTVGRQLAAALGVEYVEGDDLHPPRNVELMRAGTPLTDEHRAGWLTAVARRLREARDGQRGMVVACSALKRSYRDRLRDEGTADLRFVFLDGDRRVLEERLATRKHRYMPATLLQSQLDTLQPPAADEAAIVVDFAEAPETIVAKVLQCLNDEEPPP